MRVGGPCRVVPRVWTLVRIAPSGALSGGRRTADCRQEEHGGPQMRLDEVTVTKRLAAVGAAAVFLLSLSLAAPAAHADPEVTSARIDGADRYDTAALTAEMTFSAEDTTTALVARADDFADALAGAAAAGGELAPILLVDHDRVPDRTAEALAELEVERVLILGGVAAVGHAVGDQLAADYSVARLAGADRYETAAEIAAHLAAVAGIDPMFGDTAALLASGEDFPDALAGGPLAYSGQLPMLLTPQTQLAEATRQALVDLGIERVLILGGTAAVSAGVEEEVADLGITVERVAGRNRTDTAAQLADMLVDTWGYSAGRPMLAAGHDFPDALAAGPRGGAEELPILLTGSPTDLSAETDAWLEARCPDVDAVQAVGGSAAVSVDVLSAAVDAAEACLAPDPDVVSTFTTPLVPGEPRNVNIHLAADYIDGDVIASGASYSLNAGIGPRTRERGFVENGFIDDDGNLISVVGGGVSQMGTTFLNAAWFAGIELVEFRQHSIYFERYPMCREATLAWDTLDVVVVNDSPYEITISTTHDDSSVTVSFVSVPWATVDSWIGEPYDVTGPGGAFSVNCGRTVTYPDGTTSSDEYSWRYTEGYPN